MVFGTLASSHPRNDPLFTQFMKQTNTIYNSGTGL